MTEPRAATPEPDYETIRPVEVDIKAPADGAKALADKPQLLPWVIFLVLFLVLGGVVLVLPSLVDEPEPPAVAVDSSGETTSAQKTDTPQISPWEQAQQTKAREQAKAALDAILDNQFTLQELGVADWAGEQFETALALARSGDEAYRSQKFVPAESAYRKAGEILAGLLNSANAQYDQQIARGMQALVDADAETAALAFQIALRIRPDDEPALNGLQRAAVLDEVVKETQAAARALRIPDLVSAIDGYKRALVLDPEHEPAQQGLITANQQMRQIRFGEAMSQGYAALTAGQFVAAKKEFGRAAKLNPGSAEAREAISQVDQSVTLQKIDKLFKQGKQAAEAEEWQQAVTHYQDALDVDPSLQRAQLALGEAQTRVRLDKVVLAALDNPLGLVDEQQYQTTLSILRNAATLDNPGPKLQDQLRRLAVAMRQARTPVATNFASDSRTSVNLLRFHRLGTFNSISIDLNPGEYVVIGRRSGYRDVRHEFVIEPGQRTITIDVRCTELI